MSAPNSDATLRYVQANGIRIRLAEQGDGPLVLLLHGFPELWYSWRKQLPALAQAGYHAVALDMRGYGGTDAPSEVEAYDILDLCGDVVGVLDALGEDEAVLVGHDWGAAVAWQCVLLEPERFRGLVTLSVPWGPRGEKSPLARMREGAGENFNYMLYFQEPGVAEAELEADPRDFLRRLYASPDTPREAAKITDRRASAGGFKDRLGVPTAWPSWITPAEMDYFVSEFTRTGFRGGLNYYRNFDQSWAAMAPTVGQKIEVPTRFIAGEKEFLIQGRTAEDLSTSMRQIAPLVDVHIIPGNVGHWVQEERPEIVNRLLIDFLRNVGS